MGHTSGMSEGLGSGSTFVALLELCPVTLRVLGSAIAVRGTSAPASVWGHAAADCGAADTIGLALPLRLQNLEPKEEGRCSV